MPDATRWLAIVACSAALAACPSREPSSRSGTGETHCGEIYLGTTDSGHAGDRACYDSVRDFFAEVEARYADIVDEVNMYELMDEPSFTGPEAHFGVLTDLLHPKAIFSLLARTAE